MDSWLERVYFASISLDPVKSASNSIHMDILIYYLLIIASILMSPPLNLP